MNPIVEKFEQAAATYDKHSQVQKEIAAQLANLIGEYSKGRGNARILELGCGTGNLTRLLSAQFPNAEILATDASQGMLSKAARLWDYDNVTFAQWDVNQKPEFDEPWNLITSSMTFQWIAQLEELIRGLQKRCERLAFSIPLYGTFHNWIDAHRELGFESGIREFVEFETLCSWLHSNSECEVKIERQDFTVKYEATIDFVRNLKLIGGSAPRVDHTPVNLKRVLNYFPNGIEICYSIAFVVTETKE